MRCKQMDAHLSVSLQSWLAWIPRPGKKGAWLRACFLAASLYFCLLPNLRFPFRRFTPEHHTLQPRSTGCFSISDCHVFMIIPIIPFFAFSVPNCWNSKQKTGRIMSPA